ncbi:MAG: VCBS repeat-containing protein, partial [Rhodocyclaceae bacterium]|nr:VCBS repeat-containing protein [Rhodocyclaceae bacterium]
MKIAASSVDMSASHSYSQTTTRNESLRAWIGDVRPDFEGRN